MLISSPNFQTLPEIASGDLGRAGDASGDRRGGDGRRRGHIDARAEVAHAALEIAGAGSDAGLTGPEHAHMAAETRAAGGRRDHGTRLHQGRDVAPSERGVEYRLRCRGDEETNPWRDPSTLDDPCRFGQVVQGAVGAGPDKRLLDRLASNLGDRDRIADHRVRQRDQRFDIVEVYLTVLRIACIRVGILRRERSKVALSHIINQPVIRLEGCKFGAELGTHRSQGAPRVDAETGKRRAAELDILVGMVAQVPAR